MSLKDTPPEKVSFAEFKLIDLDEVPATVPELILVTAELERMPILQAKICGTWGTQELDSFLNTLVMDSRDGTRAGLPVEVAEEVLFLTSLNKAVRAIDLAKQNGIKFEAALELVSRGDDARHMADVWDNPNSSLGTTLRKNSRSEVSRRELHVGERVNFIEFLTMLVINKWVLGAIIVVLTVKAFGGFN
jgi:hypothetical protein